MCLSIFFSVIDILSSVCLSCTRAKNHSCTLHSLIVTAWFAVLEDIREYITEDYEILFVQMTRLYAYTPASLRFAPKSFLSPFSLRGSLLSFPSFHGVLLLEPCVTA